MAKITRPLIATVQYLCWVDLLSFFIIIGPTALVFFASSGVSPYANENKVVFPNGTVIEVPFKFYRAERDMILMEYKMVQNVRKGCGRLYMRQLVEQWDGGSHVTLMSTLTIFAMIIPLVSAVFFLIFVPGKTIFSKCVPLAHLTVQLISVSMMMVGNYVLIQMHLCLLNHIWNDLGIQLWVPLLSILIASTYKAYEISAITAHCQEHFILHFGQEYEEERAPSEEFLSVMEKLKESDAQHKREDGGPRGGGMKALLQRLEESRRYLSEHDSDTDVDTLFTSDLSSLASATESQFGGTSTEK